MLASQSTHRAALLRSAGYIITVDPSHIDERAADHLLGEVGAEGLALELARRKAAMVAVRHAGSIVLAADQVGVLGEGGDAVMLTKQPDVASAVAQLMLMNGRTHRLVNGVVLYDVGSDIVLAELDVHEVTMRSFARDEARRYVERFEPFDSSGSYQLEHTAQMEPGEALVSDVRGEHDSGVLGLPLPLLRRMLVELREVQS